MSVEPSVALPPAHARDELEDRGDGIAEVALGKARRRLVPFLTILFLVSIIDRANVGFAALEMNRDLGLSAVAYGTGAGLFFLGYFLFEVPSNAFFLRRLGARVWLSCIMLSWSVVSAAMAWASSPLHFYCLRFLLGLAESGFLPGVIFYLSTWFPEAMRGRVMGMLFVAIPLSSAIAAPVSTALLHLSFAGFKGWQMLFIVEALPAFVGGLIALYWLADTPSHARWLTPREADALTRMISRETAAGAGHGSFMDGLFSAAVWKFALALFGTTVGIWGFVFWAPQMLKALPGIGNDGIGLLAFIPNALAAVAVYFWARRSDQRQERRWHSASAVLLGAAGFVGTMVAHGPVTMELAFCAIAIGIYSAAPTFWAMPTAVLSGAAAAAGIAVINAVGNLGGYAGPFLIGYIRTVTGDYAMGALTVACFLVFSALMILVCPTSPARDAQNP